MNTIPERTIASRERGSALPLVALSLAFLVVMAMLLTLLTGRVHDQQQAQTAADAAALAGAAAGEHAARSLAEQNGAALVSFRAEDLTVSVTVEVRGVEAVASARLSVVLDP